MIKRKPNKLIKTFLSFSSVFLLSSLVSCNNTNDDEIIQDEKKKSQEEKDPVKETKEIQILATSDLHGKFLPYDYMANAASNSGSVAQVSTKVKELKKANPNTLVFDNGDALQDNLSEIFTQNAWLKNNAHPMIDAMNLLGYDGLGLGNHEFNYGVPTLEKIYGEANAPIICGNVFKEDGSTLVANAVPHKIYETAGIKVGVIGAVTSNIERWDSVNLQNYVVKDPGTTIKDSINAIKNQVDVLVLLAHMGENNEYGVANSGISDISKTCPELNLIIAGHDHKKTTNKTEEGIPYLENANQGQTLGKATLTFTKETNKWKLSDTKTEVIDIASLEPDPKIVSNLADANTYAITDATTPIATYTDVMDLHPESEIQGIATGKIQPTLITQLINQVQSDNVKKYIQSKGSAQASTGRTYAEYSNMRTISATGLFVESANVKVNSTIRKCDVSNIYSYTNTLYALEMNGAQLKKYLEWCGTYYNKLSTDDLTISFNKDMRGYLLDVFTGIDYSLNLSKDPGQRVENLKWSDTKAAVNNSDVFVLAVNNYRATSQLLVNAGKTDDLSAGVFSVGDEVAKLIDVDIYGDGIREQIMKYIQEKAAKNNNNFTVGDLITNWSLTGCGSNKNGWTAEDIAKREQIIQGIADNKICVVHGAGVVDGSYKYLGLDTVTSDYKNTFTAVSRAEYNKARYTNVRSITKQDVATYLA